MGYAAGNIQFGTWTTPVIRRLLWINLAVYLAHLVSSRWAGWGSVVLLPESVFANGTVWQIFTYMYVHFDMMHLLGNLLGIWMFGCEVERMMGSRPFLFYYTACGLGAAIAACVAYPHSHILGASGAFYGVLYAFVVYFPDRPVYLFGIAPIQARWLAVLYGVIDVVGSIQGGTGIAHLAHLGGLATGAVFFFIVGKYRFSLLRRESESPAPAQRDGIFARWKQSVLRALEERRITKRRRMAAELDSILDKISRSGMNSLTSGERRRLKTLGKELRRPPEDD